MLMPVGGVRCQEQAMRIERGEVRMPEEQSQEPAEEVPADGGGRTWTREMVSDLLPDASDPKRTNEQAAATVGTAGSATTPRVSGGSPKSLPATWLSYISPQTGLRSYALSLVSQQDTEAGLCYTLALEWMDRRGYPPREQKDLPDGLLGDLATRFVVSEQTIRRRLARAESILAGISFTLS